MLIVVRIMKKKLIVLVICFVYFFLSLLTPAFSKALTVMSKQDLLGMVIAIDAGHGGHDPGAKGGNIFESELNLKVAKKLKHVLENAGAKIIMIRNEDIDLSKEGVRNIKRSDLSQRVEILDSPNITFFISLHGNISLDHRVKGSEAYYQEHNPASHELANNIQGFLRVVTSSKLQPKEGNYYILNQTKNLGVIIEYGFLSNDEDQKKLKQDKYLEDIVYAIYQGIALFTQNLQ